MFNRSRRRGRPPKSGVVEKSRLLNCNSIKRSKYLSDSKDELYLNSVDGTSLPVSSDKKHKPRGRPKGKQHLKDKISLRNYYVDSGDERDSEYHYGSDFGEYLTDKSESNISESEIDDNLTRDESCDSEYSVSSYSTNGTNKKNYPYVRNLTPEPVWLQNRDIPNLELPKPSDDLLLTREYVMQALCIYEVLRHFRTLVRLSPFLFEDFCAVLVHEELSYLLSEIHMMLLKAILREEDVQQTHFGALDQKDSVNSVLYFIDPMTWPEVLRSYVESDTTFDGNILQILNSCEYPFTSTDNRLKVMQFLTDQFLITSSARDDLVQHEGNIFYCLYFIFTGYILHLTFREYSHYISEIKFNVNFIFFGLIPVYKNSNFITAFSRLNL